MKKYRTRDNIKSSQSPLNYSENYLKQSTSSQFMLNTLIRLAPARRIINAGLRKFMPQPNRLNTVECKINDSLDQIKEHYQKHRWAFIENIFPQEFHELLLARYPPRRYFDPVDDRKKSYDSIKIYNDVNLPPDRSTFKNYPELLSFMNYLMRDEFKERVSKIAGEPGFRCGPHLHMTKSFPGTFLIPHQDSAYDTSIIKSHLNMVFFIDGSGGYNSGGTTISYDNERKDIIFEPLNLTNTCLIYDIRAPFFHGFEPITSGKFRYAMLRNYFIPTNE